VFGDNLEKICSGHIRFTPPLYRLGLAAAAAQILMDTDLSDSDARRFRHPISGDSRRLSALFPEAPRAYLIF